MSKKIGWLNIYWVADRWQAGGLYLTKKEADAIAKPHRVAAVRVILPSIPEGKHGRNTKALD
jgi:hypothetical protein